MHTNLLPILVAVSFGWMPLVLGHSESILTLEPRPSKSPFRNGEQLDIRGDATMIFTGVTRITVLDTEHWPWVRVKWEQRETWLNFDHVVIVKNVLISK